MDNGGLYDRKERFWKEIENTILMCCGATPTGGRNALTLRFTRHFNMINYPTPNEKQLKMIFVSILKSYLQEMHF